MTGGEARKACRPTHCSSTPIKNAHVLCQSSSVLCMHSRADIVTVVAARRGMSPGNRTRHPGNHLFHERVLGSRSKSPRGRELPAARPSPPYARAMLGRQLSPVERTRSFREVFAPDATSPPPTSRYWACLFRRARRSSPLRNGSKPPGSMLAQQNDYRLAQRAHARWRCAFD